MSCSSIGRMPDCESQEMNVWFDSPQGTIFFSSTIYLQVVSLLLCVFHKLIVDERTTVVVMMPVGNIPNLTYIMLSFSWYLTSCHQICLLCVQAFCHFICQETNKPIAVMVMGLFFYLKFVFSIIFSLCFFKLSIFIQKSLN